MKIWTLFFILLILLSMGACGKVKHELGGEAKVAPITATAHVYYGIDPKLMEIIEGICHNESDSIEEYYKCMDKRIRDIYETFGENNDE